MGGNFVLDIALTTSSLVADVDLGSATGIGVASGSIDAADETIGVSCAPTGPDVLLSWTAPGAGEYTFDLAGSDFDAVLSLHTTTGCGDTEIECHDHPSFGGESLTMDLTASESVIIDLAAWAGVTTGNYILNITGP